MARSYLLFRICWNHSFSRLKVQNLFSPFKLMIDNAIYLNLVSKKIFFSAVSIYRLLLLQGFRRFLIKCLNSKRSNFSGFFSLHCLYILHFDLLYRYVQVVKILLFTLKISFLLLFHNLLFQNMLTDLAGKESPQHVLLNI